jgi:two-component system phosphate regulon sensor histidine kinase PhoR
MSRKTIRLIIFFAAFTVIGVFSFQIFWVKKAFSLEEKQFNERVHVALSSVVKEVQKLNKDSSAIYEPVKQISSNYFLASTNDTLHPYLLQNLLTTEFKNRNLESNFEYVLYDCFTDSIVFGDFVEIKSDAKNLVYQISEKDKWNQASHYFGVYFPDKETYLINEMGIWIVSTIFLLLVVVFFSYTIWAILQQRKLSEVRTEFINNMTHELKTPISTISLSTEVLSNPNITQNPERLMNYANIIKEETQRLQEQVDKVLQMATLDKNKVDLQFEKVNLHDILKKTITGFELILDSKDGKIERDLDATNAFVMGDKTHLTNVFFNLMDNAIKYSDNKPVIHVSTKDHKSGIHIRVKDNGIGMNREQQKHVFENFYRVPTQDRHDVKGFGIGLNYVMKMVKKHNGKIQLRSELKQGSTFRIYLPRAKDGKK